MDTRLLQTSVGFKVGARPLTWEQHANLSCSICAGCPSFGGQRTAGAAWKNAMRLRVFKRRVVGGASVNIRNKQPRVSSAMPRSRSSLALRSTAAPGRLGRASTGFARAGGVGAFGYDISQREIQTGQAVSSPARSNPSIEML